jgi:FkbM family methyltransferase
MLTNHVRKVAQFVTGKKLILPEEEAAYRRLLAKGFTPAGIVDVGAYEGYWTRMARQIFPGVPVLMVEPQPAKKLLLNQVCSDLQGVSYEAAVLSSRSGETVTFFEMETGSSLMPENSNVARAKLTLQTRTLDELARDLYGPLFLKIDVQGAELQVLAGGQETLNRAEIVQLEIAMLPYNNGAPTFLEGDHECDAVAGFAA